MEHTHTTGNWSQGWHKWNFWNNQEIRTPLDSKANCDVKFLNGRSNWWVWCGSGSSLQRGTSKEARDFKIEIDMHTTFLMWNTPLDYSLYEYWPESVSKMHKHCKNILPMFTKFVWIMANKVKSVKFLAKYSIVRILDYELYRYCSNILPILL